MGRLLWPALNSIATTKTLNWSNHLCIFVLRQTMRLNDDVKDLTL